MNSILHASRWLNLLMKVRITSDQREALVASNGRPIVVMDEESGHEYVLIDRDNYSWMIAQSEIDALESIRRGIEQMEAGQCISLEEMDRSIREELNLPPRAQKPST